MPQSETPEEDYLFTKWTRAEDQEIVGKLKENDPEAVDKATRIVETIANKYRVWGCSLGSDFDDLVQDGWIGLLDALDKYDPNEGPLLPYVSLRIKGEIIDALRERATLIKIGHHIYSAIRQLIQSREELVLENGCEPSVWELAKKMGKSVLELRTIFQAQRAKEALSRRESLNSELSISDGWLTQRHSLIDRNVILNRGCSVDKPVFDQVADTNDIAEVMKRILSEIENTVIGLRFGLNSYNGETLNLKETSELLDCSESWINRVKGEALKKLKNSGLSK